MAADLTETFGFSDEDLEYNRLGNLSPRQTAEALRSMRRNRIGYAVLATICAAVAAGLTVTLVVDGIEGNVGYLIGAIVAAAGVLLFVPGLFEGPDTKVRVAEGRARFVESESDTVDGDGIVIGTSTIQLLLLDGESFQIDPDQFGALAEGHLYRVYHQPRPDPILSVEYVSAPLA